MLGTDARVIEARGNRMRFLHLAILVLQDDRVCALQYARCPGRQRRRILPESVSRTTCLDANQLDVIADQRIEKTDSV